MIEPTKQLTLSDLLELVRRYHPVAALDLDPGYAELPEVRRRSAAQARAEGSDEWRALLGELQRAWPTAKLLDYSRLELDTARHVRIMRDPAEPGHHLVVWVSLLAPVALVYESRQPPGKTAVVSPPTHASDAEGIERLSRLVEAHDWQLLPWPWAMEPVPEIAVGNLLPGEATLSSCLFSGKLW